MKTKVFALILAILCLSMTVVGCGNECAEHIDEDKDTICDKCGESIVCETHTDEDGDKVCDVCGAAVTPACEKHVDGNNDFVCDTCAAKLCDHKDENADNVCDACELAIVAIDVQLPPEKEDRVNMVVKPIPNDVTLDTYFYTDLNLPVYGSAEKLDSQQIQYRYALYVNYGGGANAAEYTVKDVVSGESVYTQTLDSAKSNVELHEFYIRVVTRESTTLASYEYISYNGKSFFAESVDSAAGEYPTDMSNGETVYDGYRTPIYYKLLADGKYYIFDVTTKHLLFSDMSAKTFVDRPDFSVANENYGYRMNDGKLYVYDLSKWIDCVYTYQFPSYVLNPAWYVLENGNVLIQETVLLPDHAASYDYIANGDKYDIVNTMVDVAKKSEAKVEFGYLIATSNNYSGHSILKDHAVNLFSVYPIVNDRIDSSVRKYLIVENDLTILYDCQQTLAVGNDFPTLRVVGENLFCVRRNFNDDRSYYDTPVYEVLNEKGEHLLYLPTSAELYTTYVKYEGKYYNYKMELIVDPATEGFGFVMEREHFAIFSRYENSSTVYYVFDGKSLSRINLAVAYIINHDLGYVVQHSENGSTVYSLYSVSGDWILDSDALIYSNAVELGDGVVRVQDQNGMYYLVK